MANLAQVAVQQFGQRAAQILRASLLIRLVDNGAGRGSLLRHRLLLLFVRHACAPVQIVDLGRFALQWPQIDVVVRPGTSS